MHFLVSVYFCKAVLYFVTTSSQLPRLKYKEDFESLTVNISIYNTWKRHQKTRGSPKFSGDIKREHCPEIA